MPKCEDCNRFVTVSQADPELDIVLNHKRGMISIFGTVRLTTCCDDCGAELREAYQEFGQDLGFHHIEAGCRGEPDLLWEEAEAYQRMEGTGGQVKKFCGANVRARVVCPDCDAALEVEDRCEVQDSLMEPIADQDWRLGTCAEDKGEDPMKRRVFAMGKGLVSLARLTQSPP